MADYSSMTREELLEIGMTRGFPELIDQWTFVEGPAHPDTVFVDYLSLMSKPENRRVSVGVPFRDGWHYVEKLTRFWQDLVKQQEALARTSKLHKAYHAKKRTW